MKPSQLNSSSVGRIQDTTKNALNSKENPLGKKQGVKNSAAGLKQAKGTNRAEVVSSLKDGKKGAKLPKDFENASPQINEYLKMISRFENKVKQDQIEDKDLERVMKALEDKVLSMSSPQQKRLKNLEIFKEKGIENFNNMKDVLMELFENKAERETFFNFLKSPDFVTILLNEQDPVKGYSPAPNGPASKNVATVKPPQSKAQTPKTV